MTPCRPTFQRFFDSPRPADWMDEMTVCIAGVAQKAQNKTIIAMSDMRVSTQDFGADGMAMKFRDIHSDWKAMFSGNDVTRVTTLLDEAYRKLSDSDTSSLRDVEHNVNLWVKTLDNIDVEEDE